MLTCLNSAKPIEKPGTSSQTAWENGQNKMTKEMHSKLTQSSTSLEASRRFPGLLYHIKPQERKWQRAVMELAPKTEPKSVNRSVTFS